MTTTTTGIAATTPDHQAEDRVDAASRYVHAAEGQLHTARESGVPSWQSAAAQTLHVALEEYLAAQAALGQRRAVPLIEAHQPGWQVESDARTYLMWAPRPELDHGVTAGGAPVRSPGRPHWSACWDSQTDTGRDFWRAETLDAVLAPMPADVAAAFRAAATQ